jgi:cytochrome c2
VLVSCADAEEQGRDAVRRELADPGSARFGRYTRVGTRACLTVNARDSRGVYTGDRQALLVKAETHGENRPWSPAGMYDEGHHACVARITAGDPQPREPDTGSALPYLAAADPQRGEQLFRKCAACHIAQADGPDGLGPNLWGTIGAPIARRPAYPYSPSLAAKDGTWNWENMDSFLASPRNFAPGTKMTFAGIRTAQDRADLLAWLNRRSHSPLPLP